MKSQMPNVLPALAQLNNMNPTATFTLTLTMNQINTIMAGLGEIPFKTSNEIIQEIVRQFNEQNKPELEMASPEPAVDAE